MASFEQWAASVKRQMVELGMSSSEAFFAIDENEQWFVEQHEVCLLYTSPSPRDLSTSRMPSSA